MDNIMRHVNPAAFKMLLRDRRQDRTIALSCVASLALLFFSPFLYLIRVPVTTESPFATGRKSNMFPSKARVADLAFMPPDICELYRAQAGSAIVGEVCNHEALNCVTPGLYAMVGAAAALGGVTRMTGVFFYGLFTLCLASSSSVCVPVLPDMLTT